MQLMVTAANLALRRTTEAFNSETEDLINAALADLGIAGITKKEISDTSDSLVKRAVITYVMLHQPQPDDYDRLKKSYDEQKAQLQTASGYTNWGTTDGQV
jgi:hypothetical protein